MKYSSFICFACLSLVTGASMPGCGGTVGSSFEGKEATCERYCEQQVECGVSNSADTCREQCTDNELVSRSGQEVLTECFALQDCDSQNVLALADCIEDGIEDLPVSATAQQFCNVAMPNVNECSGDDAQASFDSGDCEETAAFLSDEILTDINECAEKSCASMQTCLIGVFIAAAGSAGLDDLGSLDDILGGGFDDMMPTEDGGEAPSDPAPSGSTSTGGTSSTGTSSTGGTSLGGSPSE